MITLTYTVFCDGPHPDDPGESCEAEFSFIPTPGRLSDVEGLRRQLDGRGWTYKHKRFVCPLHTRKVSS